MDTVCNRISIMARQGVSRSRLSMNRPSTGPWPEYGRFHVPRRCAGLRLGILRGREIA